MPYVSKKEMEVARWAVLAETIEQIQTVDKIEKEQALKLLITAIEDQNVHGRLDGRKLRPRDFQGRVLICLDSPGWMYLDRESVRKSSSLEIAHGPVNDPKDLDGVDFSHVTILREDVNKYWPFDESLVSDQKLTRPKRLKNLAKNYSKSAAKEAAKKMYDSAKAMGLNPPNKPEAYTAMSQKGFPRSIAQPVLEKPEIAQYRRKAGNQGTPRSRPANLQERS